MAISSLVQWEVRTTGADTNGGGFHAGASGLDYSQQNAAQVVINNSTITATTTGPNSNTLTFTAGYTATANDVGNIVQITGGTNINTGFYEITGFTSTTWTVTGTANLTTGTGGGSAITGNMGGALATIGKAATSAVAGNTVWIKASATYTITASITPGNSGSTTLPITYSGYTTSRGDGGQITVACSTNSVHMIDLHGQSYLIFQNFILANTAATPGHGVAATTANCTYITLDNFQISGCNHGTFLSNVASGEFYASKVLIGHTEVKSCTGDGIRICGTTTLSAVYVHNCVNGVFVGNGDNNNILTVKNAIIASNSGIGVKLNYNSVTYEVALLNCDIHGNTSDGVNIPTTAVGGGSTSLALVNNIIDSNGGWGVNSAAALSGFVNRNNAYRSNTSGNLNNIAAGMNDVTLTGDPYVNAASGNYALNNTAGAGAACRAAGYPGTFVGGTTTGYLDIGAVQHQDTGGGGVTAPYIIGG